MLWQQNLEHLRQKGAQQDSLQGKPQTIINIIDSGQGIANNDNLFVPFYSTKPQGSGIGLIISREFIRNQDGELTLKNRQDARGAIASISLQMPSDIN